MHPFLQSKRTVPPDDQIESSRRKVRKGTQSCWECKKRKVRCNFATSNTSTCDNCKRRRAICTSQEFPDRSTKVDDDSLFRGRLTKLESDVHYLIRSIDPTPGHNSRQSFNVLQPEAWRDEASHLSLPEIRKTRTNEPLPGTSERQAETSPVVGWNHDVASFQRRQQVLNPVLLEPIIPSLDEVVGGDMKSNEVGQYDRLSCTLLKAWPCRHDLDIILDLPGEVSGLFHGTICGPLSTIPAWKNLTARQIIRLPPTGSHPVLIVRQLLLLATWLQSLTPSCSPRLDELSIEYRALMSSTFEAANNVLLHHDELRESIEGIECIMIASMYLNNAGNLRKAWYSISRAILVAQMMGLHQNPSLHCPMFLDEQTRARIYPDYMWFRLIQMNRYLAMMLGLPQSTSSNIFADCHVLKKCMPTERMQRLDCAAGGYILQRNEAGLYDKTTTQMIDQMLRESGASLPDSWWQIPDCHSSTSNELEVLDQVLRVMDQLTHYHLVAQLHLPFITRPHTDHEYDYSKKMVMNASREILLRFTSLHSAPAFTSFCRGINFLAFIACTTMSITHMSTKCQRQECSFGNRALLDSLADQYQRDRDMMELTLHVMRDTAHENKDANSLQTSSILSCLLAMEASEAVCEKDMTDSTPGAGRGLGCGGKVSHSSRSLEIHIPYFGTTRFKESTIPGTISKGLPSLVNWFPTFSASEDYPPDSLLFAISGPMV